MRGVAAATIAIGLAAGVFGATGDMDAAVRGIVTRYFRFSPGDLGDLQLGKIVKHSIDAPSPGEVAVAGGVRVWAAKRTFLERVRDITRFKRSPEVLEIGRFSSPPTIQDLASLTIDREDFDVSDCRERDCDVRLPAAVIRQFQREINPSAPDARERTASLFKQVLLDNVIAYEKGETQGRILEYNDGDRPIRPADEFEGVLRNSPALSTLVPSLPDHFRHYPVDPISGDDDFLYWSKEKFGIAPFVTVTHVTIVCPAAATCVMATRDVYSSRYIDASLSITIATDVAGDPGSFYLMFANRSRANALKGSLGGLRRALAARRARASIDDNLKRIKGQLESGLAQP